ncbi:hypothetical protein MKY92_25285 [Paenibacillus sp. FSL R5-0623]|uniref:hypothetical protein n=1 Tax=Paenibacillus sp. FSL R5-0623 TaxID=2921651 RepID=UPI0030DB94E8
MLKKWMRNKMGYVSIETVIVAGLVIALGAFSMQEFYATAQGVVKVSMDKLDLNEMEFHFHTGDVVEVEL